MSSDNLGNPDGDALNNLQEYQNNSDPNLADNLLGDINNDGLINVADMLLIQRHIHNYILFDQFEIARGDLYPANSGDGFLSISDALILSKLAIIQ